jgi:hypothetical protein
VAQGEFLLGTRKAKFVAGKDGNPQALEIANDNGPTTRLVFEPDWKPSTSDLNDFAGDWYSEEAQSRISLSVDNGKLVLILRPVSRFQLAPVYKDGFSGQGYVFWFTRDSAGKIDKLHVGTGRMRDMPFSRVK